MRSTSSARRSANVVAISIPTVGRRTPRIVAAFTIGFVSFWFLSIVLSFSRLQQLQEEEQRQSLRVLSRNQIQSLDDVSVLNTTSAGRNMSAALMISERATASNTASNTGNKNGNGTTHGNSNNNNNNNNNNSNNNSSLTKFHSRSTDDQEKQINIKTTPMPSLTKKDVIMKEIAWNSPIVVHEYKLVFFTVPKAGCSEWKYMLRRMMGYHDNSKSTGEGSGCLNQSLFPNCTQCVKIHS